MKNLSAFWAAAAGVAVGIVLFAVLGAGTIEDSGIFQSLELGGKTNLISDDGAALTYNGTHYQISSATLTNASTNTFTGTGLIVLQTAVPANQTNATLASLGGMAATAALTNLNEGIGTGLTNLLASAVQAGQTNETTASITNKLGGFSGATGSYLGADGLMHTVTSAQTNDGTANWSASGTTNSTLTGTSSPYSLSLNGGNAQLFSDAANALWLRNGTNAQRFNVPHTFTSDSDYETLSMNWIGNNGIVGFDYAGGGSARDLYIGWWAQTVLISIANAAVAQFDANASAGNTRFLVWDVDKGAVSRVSVGTNDSGGSGYKLLRVPN